MNKGNPGWEKNVKNFDNLKGPEKIVTNDGNFYSFRGQQYQNYVKDVQAQGYIEEYYGDQRCFSSMINNPGVSLLPNSLLGAVYLVFLGYLFLGINISADIFMEAIEVITSKTQVKEVVDEASEKSFLIEVPVWNPTMANLTLMAFGSSAPEIILNVLQAFTSLGEPQSDLGPSTIVGSAAFNLLVISGVSIVAIDDGVKKIDDMGVFLTTSVFSVFAYVWLYICLAVNSEGEVTVSEAAWTLSFFFILLILAFCADKYNQRKKAKIEGERSEMENILKMKKSHLRSIARTKGEAAVLAAAQGQRHDQMSEADVQNVKELYQDILQTNNLQEVSLDVLM